MIKKILYPVDFSPSCIAMAGYVKRAAALLDASVTLIHVVDPTSHNGFEIYLRPPQEISEEHLSVGRHALESFLSADFPVSENPRILDSGDPSVRIARVAREGDFNLIIMPTHSGLFRRMLLGSTTAKVLNDADCPVLTSRHAETIAPRPLEHREWLCAVGLSANSERVLRFAAEAAAQASAQLSIIHALPGGDPNSPIQLDIEERVYSAQMQQARGRIAALQQRLGLEVPVRIVIGQVKDALLQMAQQSDADALIIGRSSQPSSYGRLRDLTYAMIRDSPFPVLSV